MRSQETNAADPLAEAAVQRRRRLEAVDEHARAEGQRAAHVVLLSEELP